MVWRAVIDKQASGDHSIKTFQAYTRHGHLPILIELRRFLPPDEVLQYLGIQKFNLHWTRSLVLGYSFSIHSLPIGKNSARSTLPCGSSSFTCWGVYLPRYMPLDVDAAIHFIVHVVDAGFLSESANEFVPLMSKLNIFYFNHFEASKKELFTTPESVSCS
ncbi:hypothetical protein Ancab_013187 [Ancistrocladus abbreviatus]